MTPANHLDTVGRQVLSAYLHDKHGFILVSHDRVLLDGCTDHVLAINRSSVELVKGSYSSWKSDFISRQNNGRCPQHPSEKRNFRHAEKQSRKAPTGQVALKRPNTETLQLTAALSVIGQPR